MSFLSLVVPSPTQKMMNVSEANRQVERGARFQRAGTFPTCPTKMPPTSASGADDYLLPAGIVSLEHWLDLNA